MSKSSYTYNPQKEIQKLKEAAFENMMKLLNAYDKLSDWQKDYLFYEFGEYGKEISDIICAYFRIESYQDDLDLEGEEVKK